MSKALPETLVCYKSLLSLSCCWCIHDLVTLGKAKLAWICDQKFSVTLIRLNLATNHLYFLSFGSKCVWRSTRMLTGLVSIFPVMIEQTTFRPIKQRLYQISIWPYDPRLWHWFPGEKGAEKNKGRLISQPYILLYILFSYTFAHGKPWMHSYSPFGWVQLMPDTKFQSPLV